jgi:hypothetical protein
MKHWLTAQSEATNTRIIAEANLFIGEFISRVQLL